MHPTESKTERLPELTPAALRLLTAIKELNGKAYTWNLAPYLGYEGPAPLYRPLKIIAAHRLIRRKGMRIELTTEGKELAEAITITIRPRRRPPQGSAPAAKPAEPPQATPAKAKPKLTPAAIDTLRTAHALTMDPEDDIQPCAIARARHVCRQSVTEPLKRLADLGLIEHQPHAKALTITPAGLELIRAIEKGE